MSWGTGLLLFGLCWALQIAGTVLQMRHYRSVLDRLSAQWQDGYVGTGSARARFGRGAITILVVSPSGAVRQALAMQGRTVWAKFKPLPALVGVDIAQFRTGSVFRPRDVRLAEAFRRAVEQVDRIIAERAASSASSPVALPG